MTESGLTTAEAVWAETAPRFANLHAMRPRLSWFNGISQRANQTRLDKLTGSGSAKSLQASLAALPDRELRRFAARAAVNLEQAISATRLSLLVNVTLPVAGVLFLAQATDGAAWDYVVRETAADPTLRQALLWVGAGMLVLLWLSVWYIYAGLQQARDIHHLTTLALADREELAATAAEDDAIPTEEVL